MNAATSYAARRAVLAESRRDAAADLLLDRFERWVRTDDAALRGEIVTIVRDPGDGSVLTERQRIIKVDRKSFRGVALGWAEDCREL